MRCGKTIHLVYEAIRLASLGKKVSISVSSKETKNRMESIIQEAGIPLDITVVVRDNTNE